MQIEEILQEGDFNKRVQYLQSQRKVTDQMIEDAKKALDPNQHAVTDPAKRPKRRVTSKIVDADGNNIEREEIKEVNRTPFPYQQDIIDKRVSFMFYNPLQVSTQSTNKSAKEILNAILAVNKGAKMDSLNREIARTEFSFYEVAEYWYVSQDDSQNRYGFVSDTKINCFLFKPDEGDVLYPFFDKRKNLIAFSRGYKTENYKGQKDEYFETWTDKDYTRLKKEGTGWVTDDSKDVSEISNYVQRLGKIPIVYGFQPKTEYYPVQRICDRNDTLASNHGDINDRHSKPILTATGEVITKIDDFVQLGEGASMEWKSWDNATESVDSEFKRNESAIYTFTRTPQMSFDAMKGLGNILSGEGLKTALSDPHLEVRNKMEHFDVYFTRRYNILLKLLSILNPKWAKDIYEVDIDVKVVPYMPGGDTEFVQSLVDLYGAGMISLETACKLNPWFEDALAEYNRIKKEQEAKDSEPSGLDQQMNNDN